MQTIVFKDNSDTEYYSIIHYPDGQKNIQLNMDKLNRKESIQIQCRVKTFNDLEIFLCLIAALQRNDFYINEVYFFYLFGMRCDRVFQTGQPNYLNDIVAKILKSYFENFNTDIYICWPFRCLPIVRGYITSAYFATIYDCVAYDEFLSLTDDKNIICIAGDESAKDHNEARAISGKEYYFSKKRHGNEIIATLDDKTIKKIEIEEPKIIRIVDDLCDGGATFIAEAIYLKEKFPDVKLELLIYHGIFSKGLDILFEYFDRIIVTNSYQDYEPHPKLTVIEVI